ncbi:hypothetical protein ACWIGI_29235 [Nocardia sp. NPDC055321]
MRTIATVIAGILAAIALCFAAYGVGTAAAVTPDHSWLEYRGAPASDADNSPGSEGGDKAAPCVYGQPCTSSDQPAQEGGDKGHGGGDKPAR